MTIPSFSILIFDEEFFIKDFMQEGGTKPSWVEESSFPTRRTRYQSLQVSKSSTCCPIWTVNSSEPGTAL